MPILIIVALAGVLVLALVGVLVARKSPHDRP